MKRTLILVVLTILLAPALLADATPDGAAIFKTNCAVCHGADGRGQTPAGKSMKLRDLGSAGVQQLTDSELAAIIANGKGKMPAFKAKLGDDGTRAVVAFIRTLK